VVKREREGGSGKGGRGNEKRGGGRMINPHFSRISLTQSSILKSFIFQKKFQKIFGLENILRKSFLPVKTIIKNLGQMEHHMNCH
jgi:hypothetical protein